VRRAILLAVVLASASAGARAQDSQDDIAARIVREQEDLHRRQFEKVAGAPARAWAPLEGGSPESVTPPAPPPAAQVRAAPAISATTWALAGGALAFVLAVRWAWVRLGKSGR
jgi:hypothetical protein